MSQPLSVTSLKIGATEVITSALVLQNVTFGSGNTFPDLGVTGATNLASGGAAAVRIGTTTANTKNAAGLTVQQGAADDEIISLKSTDVAHGATLLTETDSYAFFKKFTSTQGGLWCRAFSEGENAMVLQPTPTAANTAKTYGAGSGALLIRATLISGTGDAVMSANSNLLALDDGGGARFLFDKEGSGHSDVEWVTF